MGGVDTEAQKHPAALIVGAGMGIVILLAVHPLLAGEIRSLHGSPPRRDIRPAHEVVEGNVEVVGEGT